MVAAVVLLLAAAGLVWIGLPGSVPEAPEPAPVRAAEVKPVPILGPVTSDKGGATQPPVAEPQAQVAPSELWVPSLAIRAPLLPAPLRDDTLRVPSDPAKLGIYDQGAQPCDERGTVLLAGHVSVKGVHGALWGLHGIQPGAVIHTGCPDGATASWKVAEIRVERKEDLPQDLFEDVGERRLVIVTCGGPVITREDGRHYRDNVIVYAVPSDRWPAPGGAAGVTTGLMFYDLGMHRAILLLR